MESRTHPLHAATDNRQAKGEIKSLRHVLRYLKPYRAQIAGALVAITFTSLTMLGMGGALRFLIDEGLSKGNTHLLDLAFMLFLGVTLLLAFASYSRFYLVSWIGEKVVADLRRDVYARVIHMHTGYFETTRTGELLSRMTTDTTLLQMVVGGSVSIALRNALMLLGGTALLFITSPKLTLYVFLILPVVVVPIIVIGRRVRALSRETQARIADMNVQAEETISGIRTIQALSLESRQTAQFNDLVGQAVNTAVARIRRRSLLTALVIALIFGAIITVLWIGGHDVLTGKLSPGELSSFVFFAVVVAGSVGAVSEIIGDLQRAGGATERLVELLTLMPEIAAPANPVRLPRSFRGRIQFDHVTFNYPSRPDRAAVDNLTLTVEPGETVALVGPSGAGKSTLFHLLLRLYDPNSGEITIDGLRLRDMAPDGLRAHIGLVPQDPVIFSADAWENIRCGRPEASNQEVLAAAEMADALEFLQKLPEGLNTYLGEKGVRLSGGQRQRMAIARAIVRNPQILLLDEATSALDSEHEQTVQRALEQLMKDRTTLIIAHRLATVLKATRIVVMENGRIEAIGTHAELMAKSELYRRLAELQFNIAA